MLHHLRLCIRVQNGTGETGTLTWATRQVFLRPQSRWPAPPSLGAGVAFWAPDSNPSEATLPPPRSVALEEDLAQVERQGGEQKASDQKESLVLRLHSESLAKLGRTQCGAAAGRQQGWRPGSPKAAKEAGGRSVFSISTLGLHTPPMFVSHAWAFLFSEWVCGDLEVCSSHNFGG